MTRREGFIKKGKSKNKHCLPKSISAWCALKAKGDTLKLRDVWSNPTGRCQKQITFTTGQFQIEGAEFKKNIQKFFKGTQTTWSKLFKPAVKVAAPFMGMSTLAKTTDPQVGQATTKFSKSISAGKILSLTDLHGHCLRIRLMWFF